MGRGKTCLLQCAVAAHRSRGGVRGGVRTAVSTLSLILSDRRLLVRSSPLLLRTSTHGGIFVATKCHSRPQRPPPPTSLQHKKRTSEVSTEDTTSKWLTCLLSLAWQGVPCTLGYVGPRMHDAHGVCTALVVHIRLRTCRAQPCRRDTSCMAGIVKNSMFTQPRGRQAF